MTVRVKIYQINTDRDKQRIKFFGLDEIKKLTGESGVNPSIYDEVFSAELETDNPEEIYTQFNDGSHPLHRGHSLSITDVVMIGKSAFFCDTVGFKRIDFDESKTQKPDDLMRVVYVEPGKPAYEAEIRHNLSSMQKAVGGLIDIIEIDGGTLVSNDESKLIGMQGNRHIGESTIIAGPFFVCGSAGEDLRSLTDKETEQFLQQFAKPEDISDEEVESDMGFQFYTF